MSVQTIPIDRDIPVPPRKPAGGVGPRTKKRRPWRQMQLGDSFMVKASPGAANRLQVTLAQTGRRIFEETGMRFTTRQIEGGVRVWRIA